MENASKALIISGAVLIAIALISMGVYIISSQKGAIDGSKELSTTLEIKTHNDTFEKYKGTNKRGSEVRSLLNDVKVYNTRNDPDISVSYVSPGIGGTISDIDTIYNNIQVYGTYEVNTNYDTNGYVNSITISG